MIDKTRRQLLGADVVKDNVQRAEKALQKMEISLKAQYPTLIIETIDLFSSSINKDWTKAD